MPQSIVFEVAGRRIITSVCAGVVAVDVAAQVVPKGVPYQIMDSSEVPPEEAPPAPLSEQLDSVFMQLPPEVRAQFYPLKAAMKLALDQGDTLGALAIIKITSVPSELQDAKDAMLSLFNQ